MFLTELKTNLADIRKDIRLVSNVRDLPKRVQDTIRRKEKSSEIFVKLIQIAIVLSLGILYFIAPKANIHLDFEPVPYFLIAYLVLNIIGLYWAVRTPLPDWAIYGSILIDFTLLYGLIWSFHIQYQQPPAFMLKLPTLLYVFIFIALRALRFRARFVIASGLVAAAGWAGIIGYAVERNTDAITRDFVFYLTSNSILLGAEFDKIISILIVTGVLAVALRRANTFLVNAITGTSAAQRLSLFFDETVAAGIRDSYDDIKAGDGIRRTGAILTIDIRGFSRLANEIDADAVIAVLAAYQGAVLPIIRKHNGSIDKFMGDGIMASFGAVRESDSFARDALAAAEDIADLFENGDLDDANLKIIQDRGIGIAVAAGPMVFGAVGVEDRLELTVIGTPVNLSAKLEKFNRDLGSTLIIGQLALEYALSQGYTPRRRAEPISTQVTGIAAPVELSVMR